MEIFTVEKKIELLKLSLTIGTNPGNGKINTLLVTLENYNQLLSAISN